MAGGGASAPHFLPPPSIAEGLHALADEAERRHDFLAATSYLESALRPPHATVLLLAALLLAPRGSARTPRAGAPAAAKTHLERALLILFPLPSAPPQLKLLAHSHLAGAYAVIGAIPSLKHVLHRALGFLASASASSLLDVQLASALSIDGNATLALSALSTTGGR